MEEKSPRLNRVLERLRQRKPFTGVLVTMPSVTATQVWARSGIDVLVFDLEHAPIDITSLHAVIAATAGSPALPIVRVPWNLPWLVKPVLDAGALGIQFPMVATAADAEAAVRAMKYPPTGERGWGPFYAPLRWDVSWQRYVEVANDEVMTVLLIERPEAVANIRDIVRVPGVDMLMIAPFDLAITSGYPNRRDHPDVVRAVREVEDVVLASGIPLGGVALDANAANAMIDRGYLGLFVGYDWMVLQRGAAALLEGINLG